MPGPDGYGQRPVAGKADPVGIDVQKTDETFLGRAAKEKRFHFGHKPLGPPMGGFP